MSVDWSDVGSWDALYDALSDHESEDVTIGDVLARETGNSILVGDGVKLVTVGGERSYRRFDSRCRSSDA